MKKKDKLLIISSIPYIVTLIYSIVTIFFGVNSCLLEENKKICEIIYGFRASGMIWYKLLLSFYPIYLLFLYIFIKEVANKKKINKTRRNILYGISPILLSIFIFINAILAKTGYNLSILFSEIFINHLTILIPELIAMAYLIFIVLKIPNKKDM